MTKKTEKIGYKQPPKMKQFKPGQSGNPRGRRRRTDEEFDTMLLEELCKPVVINDKGMKRTVPVYKKMVMAVMKKVAQGDLKAIAFLEKHTQLYLTTKKQREHRQKIRDESFRKFLADTEDYSVPAKK